MQGPTPARALEGSNARGSGADDTVEALELTAPVDLAAGEIVLVTYDAAADRLTLLPR